jgi:hypothetical protein
MPLKQIAMSTWATSCGLLEKRESAFMQVKALPQCPFKSTLRVAVVKQSTYCDLYTDPFAKSAADLLASSIHRTGPIGLFINFDTQFIIVHPEPEAECRVWEEKLAFEVKGSERAERFPKLREQQAAVSVSVRDVDWSQFDLVIAIENAVPSTIAQQYPSVLWCTQLEHHRLAPYQKYLRRTPAGYDAFLHHRYGPNLGSILHKSHVVDFPYGLNSVGGLSSIYSEIPKEMRQVMLEDHQDFVQLAPLLIKKKLRWKQGGEIAGSLHGYHQRLASSQILLAPRSNRPLGGLAALDAAALDCLIIGRRADLWNPYIILPELDISSLKAAVNLAADLLEDRSRYQVLLEQQSARMNWFGWVRPLGQIAKLADGMSRELSISSQISKSGLLLTTSS